jgi:peptidoglycan/LPS O-acetylase OafA/YrhL
MFFHQIGLMDTHNNNERYLELDALRGIASLMVVFFHFTMNRPEANLGFKLGTTGVDLFFMISGFVILMSLNKIKRSADFIINRASRLYPTYWASVSFTFVLLAAYSIYKTGFLSKMLMTDYLGNLTMFQFYMNISDLDGPYWTMIIEMLFYIVMLFLFHFRILRYLDPIFMILSLLAVIGALFFDNLDWVNAIIYWVPLLQFLPLFFAGTVFYNIYTNPANRFKNYTIVVFCLISQILLFQHAGRSNGFIRYPEYVVMLALFFGIFTLFVNNKLKFIVNRTTLFLGKISFALYLIHQCISLNFIIPVLTKKLHFNFWVAAVLVALPIVILIASFITFYIEVPFGKKMKAKLRHRFINTA